MMLNIVVKNDKELSQIVRVNDIQLAPVEGRLRLVPEVATAEAFCREEVGLPPFEADTIRLNPTQLYETISMGLLFMLLMALWQQKKHPLKWQKKSMHAKA